MPARKLAEQSPAHLDGLGPANKQNYRHHPDESGEVLQTETASLPCPIKGDGFYRRPLRGAGDPIQIAMGRNFPNA